VSEEIVGIMMNVVNKLVDNQGSSIQIIDLHMFFVD
jgi:hypothetical protein